MARVHEGILSLARLVATQTTLGVLSRTRVKSKDELVRGERLRFVSSCGFLPLNMGSAWTMARFAGHDGLLRRLQVRMGGLAELRHFSLVTGLAAIAADMVRA